MEDFAPTFSLGLDFDLDSEPQINAREDPSSSNQAPQFSVATSLRTFEDDDFEKPTINAEPEDPVPPRTLKRLRRGPTIKTTSALAQKREPVKWCCVDDEIEEFSSQEDGRRDEPPSAQHHMFFSSSKLPLHGHGVLATQSAKKKEHISNAPKSANMETSSNKSVFPKLTVSPLRKFQLIDSDSDDPSVSEGANRNSKKSESSLNQRQANPPQHLSSCEQRTTNASMSTSLTDDLGEDFCPEKSFHIPTPALDEVCEEYFRSMKDKNKAQNKTNDCYQSSNVSKSFEHQLDLDDPLPPAHCYFFHDDPMIQELVRSRLPNFFPLGALNNGGFKQPSTSVIDYMGQFSHGEGSKQAAGKNKAEKSSTTSIKILKKTNTEEVSQGWMNPGKNKSKKSSTTSRKTLKKLNTEETSQGWMNPKRDAENGISKDAGKRRVHAVGRSAGHWFTGPDGRRVYINKNGQELTGQNAYRQYRKESGAGFKRSKKRTATKKK